MNLVSVLLNSITSDVKFVPSLGNGQKEFTFRMMAFILMAGQGAFFTYSMENVSASKIWSEHTLILAPLD